MDPVGDAVRGDARGVGVPGRAVVAARLLEFLARTAWFVEDEVAGVADLVPLGGTCIDVGAEYGLYTVAMAAAAGPTGTVHAVEPQPDAHAAMARTVRLAGLDDRVVRHARALGATAGRATLSVPMRRGLPVHGRAFLTVGAHDGGPNDEEFDESREVEVEVTTLDELAEAVGLRRLDLLKADVEGAELQVLQGGAATIERFRPVVQLEIEEPHLAKYGVAVDDVTGFLADRGYTMSVWVEGAWRRTERVTPAHRNYLFTP